MSLIVTSGQLRQRAEFYYQLGQLTSAGLGLIDALERLQRNPPARSYRQPIGQVLEELHQGSTLSESLRRQPSWLPAFDVALLHAGEQSGRLDVCFRVLADYYTERMRMIRQMVGDLAYPAFLFHFAVFIIPFPRFFISGNWIAYLCQTLGLLLVVYAAIFLAIYAGQSGHGEAWRRWLESVLHHVPVLGMGRRYLALGRLAGALEALLSAGVTIIEAWELAGTASGSPALRRAVLAWRPLVDAGQTPAEVVNASGKFPELFANQYASGEVSGRLDETLRRLQQYYQEEGSRKLRSVAFWVPRAIYLGIMLAIGYYIVQFWSGYFGQIRSIGGF